MPRPWLLNPTEARPHVDSDQSRSPVFRLLEKSGFARDLDGEVRQRFEARQPPAIIVGITCLAGDDRNDRAEMPRPKAPEMQIGEHVTIGLDFRPQLAGHALVGIHVEQDRAGVPDQAVRPTGDDARADDAGQRVHPKARASNRPTITSTDTAASAMTWTTAARMLLSRAVDPRACSCSSNTTG